MASTTVEVEAVRKAVNALFSWRKLNPRKPPQLFSESLPEEEEEEGEHQDSDDFVYLLLTLKKAPPHELAKFPHKIPLSHPLSSLTHKSFTLCLIIDDRPSKSPYRITSEAAQKKIKSDGIPISKVLKLSKLKSDFCNSFEKRRHLYDSFDMFFADKRLISLLPKLLGKQFYKKRRKVPVPLDLRLGSNWKEQIERARDSALFFFGSGTCSSLLKVGICQFSSKGMAKDQSVENVLAAIRGIMEVVPKKWAGVRAVHLKLSDSLALPIYEALPGTTLGRHGGEGDDMDGIAVMDKKRKNVGNDIK